MEIISLEEAREKGIKRYFTGNPCKNGHIAERVTHNNHCTVCNKIWAHKFYKNNKKKVDSSNRKWVLANKDKIRLIGQRYYKKNNLQVQESHKIWSKNNKDKLCAKSTRRRAQKLKATVGWSNTNNIQMVYTEAMRLTEATGKKYTVDHIIPFQGKLVSGLHVENNLQILTSKENCKKHNHFDPYNPTKYEYGIKIDFNNPNQGGTQ